MAYAAGFFLTHPHAARACVRQIVLLFVDNVLLRFNVIPIHQRQANFEACPTSPPPLSVSTQCDQMLMSIKPCISLRISQTSSVSLQNAATCCVMSIKIYIMYFKCHCPAKPARQHGQCNRMLTHVYGSTCHYLSLTIPARPYAVVGDSNRLTSHLQQVQWDNDASLGLSHGRTILRQWMEGQTDGPAYKNTCEIVLLCCMSICSS